jgi:hypothetical protein
MGSVRVELARGLDVAIETHTSMGSIRNNYPSHESAAAKLLLTTDMGSVRVDEGTSVRPIGRSPASYAPFRPERPEPPIAPTATAPREDPELDRILKMVEAGELSAHDADELLRAMGRV